MALFLICLNWCLTFKYIIQIYEASALQLIKLSTYFSTSLNLLKSNYDNKILSNVLQGYYFLPQYFVFVLNAWKNKFSTSKHITLKICFKIFVAHLLIQSLSRNYSKKDFLTFEGKKKIKNKLEYLGNICQLGRKLSFRMRCVNPWNEDFTSGIFQEFS